VEIVREVKRAGHSLSRFHESTEDVLSVIARDRSRGRELRRDAAISPNSSRGRVVRVAGDSGENHFVVVSLAASGNMLSAAIVVVVSPLCASFRVVSRLRHPHRRWRWTGVGLDTRVVGHSDGHVVVANMLRKDRNEAVLAGSGVVFGTTVVVEISPLRAF